MSVKILVNAVIKSYSRKSLFNYIFIFFFNSDSKGQQKKFVMLHIYFFLPVTLITTLYT